MIALYVLAPPNCRKRSSTVLLHFANAIISSLSNRDPSARSLQAAQENQETAPSHSPSLSQPTKCMACAKPRRNEIPLFSLHIPHHGYFVPSLFGIVPSLSETRCPEVGLAPSYAVPTWYDVLSAWLRWCIVWGFGVLVAIRSCCAARDGCIVLLWLRSAVALGVRYPWVP